MATVDESSSAKRWLPLEANPEVMNQVLLHSPIFQISPSNSANYSSIIVSDHRNFEILGRLVMISYRSVQFLWGLGLVPDEAECNDVFGLDDELLEMVPKPVLAVLFLYPITKKVSSICNYQFDSEGAFLIVLIEKAP